MQNYNKQQQSIILKGIAQQLLSMNLPSFDEAKKLFGSFNINLNEQEATSLIDDKEELFLSLINGYTIKEDKDEYPDSVFYFNPEGKVLFELDKSRLFCNYSLVWYVFKDRYGMDYYEIQSFIKDQVEKHFKMMGVTPNGDVYARFFKVEKHFKMMGVTPAGIGDPLNDMVEKHFKMMGVTPIAGMGSARLTVERHFKNKP